MNTTINHIASEINYSAVEEINTDYNLFIDFINKQKDKNIELFTQTFLEWYTNGRYHLLYTMFSEIIQLENKVFLDSFHSFISNFFLDDAYFRIEWRKFTFLNGKMTHVISTKEEPGTEPVVVPDHDSGTQDPILLLDTMEYFYTKFLKAEELKVKTLVNIEQLRKKLEHGDRNDSQNK
jgi:hypothetical protein